MLACGGAQIFQVPGSNKSTFCTFRIQQFALWFGMTLIPIPFIWLAAQLRGSFEHIGVHAAVFFGILSAICCICSCCCWTCWLGCFLGALRSIWTMFIPSLVGLDRFTEVLYWSAPSCPCYLHFIGMNELKTVRAQRVSQTRDSEYSPTPRLQVVFERLDGRILETVVDIEIAQLMLRIIHRECANYEHFEASTNGFFELGGMGNKIEATKVPFSKNFRFISHCTDVDRFSYEKLDDFSEHWWHYSVKNTRTEGLRVLFIWVLPLLAFCFWVTTVRGLIEEGKLESAFKHREFFQYFPTGLFAFFTLVIIVRILFFNRRTTLFVDLIEDDSNLLIEREYLLHAWTTRYNFGSLVGMYIFTEDIVNAETNSFDQQCWIVLEHCDHNFTFLPFDLPRIKAEALCGILQQMNLDFTRETIQQVLMQVSDEFRLPMGPNVADLVISFLQIKPFKDFDDKILDSSSECSDTTPKITPYPDTPITPKIEIQPRRDIQIRRPSRNERNNFLDRRFSLKKGSRHEFRKIPSDHKIDILSDTSSDLSCESSRRGSLRDSSDLSVEVKSDLSSGDDLDINSGDVVNIMDRREPKIKITFLK